MKLSKLYSNKRDVFEPIFFNSGLNVVYAEIRHPKSTAHDTHNLGKTTLVKVIDFMFLVEKDKKQFFYKHYSLFQNFIFFLEIHLNDNNYLTIKRGIENNSKISFTTHNEPCQDFTTVSDEHWKHQEVAIGKAKILLDSWMNFTSLNNYNYRKIIGYLIRTQEDFSNVFQLNKFKRGKDIDWKPYVADLLGFNGSLAKNSYEKNTEINKIKDSITIISPSGSENISQELSKIDSKLLLRQNELTETRSFVDKFDFQEIDQESISQLVEDIDSKISELNMQEYTIRNKISHIEEALDTTNIKFETDKVKKVFEEASIIFPEQIEKDFNQLIQFNNSINKERDTYLKEEFSELSKSLLLIKNMLKNLNEERSEKIGFLSENELIIKFKKSSREVAKKEAEIFSLEAQKENIEKIQELEKHKRGLILELSRIQDNLDTNVNEVNESKDNRFSEIRLYFNAIISKVLSKEGSIYVYLNDSGNFEFETNYQDIKGKNTSESDGNTYYKLLCIAFDLAVSRAYLNENYPKFLYIDGVFESLDNRKKKLLLEVLREYSSYGIQIIITTISSELVGLTSMDDNTIFSSEEIILTLHDDGSNGRLFKMQTW